MSQIAVKKADFDMAGLSLNDIYTESQEVMDMSIQDKIVYLNNLYSQQEDRIRTNDFDDDILREHDQDYINQIQLKEEKVDQSNENSKSSNSKDLEKDSKPLRTERNYEQKLLLFLNKSKDNVDKDYWYYFKEFSKQNTVFQEINKTHTPKYIPTQEDSNDPYIKKLLDQLDLSYLEKPDSYHRNNLTQWYEDQLTEEKFIRQYQITQVKKTTKEGEKEDFHHLITVQFYEFNEESYKYELNKNYRILLDIYTLNSEIFPQFLLLNNGAKFYYYKKCEIIDAQNNTIKQLQLHQYNLSKLESKINDESQYKRISKVDQYNISLPLSFNYDLQDLEYQFMIDATPGCSQNFRLYQKDLLDKQFVLVQSFKKAQSLLIYYLKDPSKPILRFQEAEFELIVQSFFTIIDDQKIVLTLKSLDTTYQIEFNPQSKEIIQIPNIDWSELTHKIIENQNENLDQKEVKQAQLESKFKLEDHPQIKFQKSLNKASQYLKNIFPIAVEVKFKDKKEKPFEQTFYTSGYSAFELIYPMHPSDESNNKRQQVVDFIKEKYDNLNQDRMNHIYFNNVPDLMKRKPQFSKYLKQQHQINDYFYWDYCIYTKDTILLNDGSYESLKILTLKKPQKHYSNFEKVKKNIKNENNHKLLNKILDNFDWKLNQKIYQDNQNFNKADSYCRRKYNFDQNLENFYINKQKKEVFSTHCNVFINDQFFTFPEQYLLIDLSDNPKDKNAFKYIKLYDEEVKQLKLVKYHKSKTQVIFFFLFRSRKYQGERDVEEQNGLQGVHFFVFKSIQKLALENQNKPLIEENCDIYIPLEINNFIKAKYDFNDLIKYIGEQKYYLGSSTWINFEHVKDQGDPIEDWLPFYYQNWVYSGIFESYFCFFNIESLSKKSEYQMQNGEEDKIDFSDHLQIFKIDFYQGITEKNKISYQSLRGSVQTMQYGQGRMFQRSSNWQKNIFTDHGEQYSAKFYIGEKIQMDIMNIELREYLVTIDLKKKCFINLEQQTLGKQEFSSNVNMIMSKLKPNLFSNQYYEQWQNNGAIQNYVLVPKIQDNGDINGAYLMINILPSSCGVQKLTNSEEVLQTEEPTLFHKLRSRLGQYIFIKESENGSKFNGQFQDGESFDDLKTSILSQDYYNQIVEIEGKENIKSFQELILSQRPKYVYDILEIENDIQYQCEYQYMQNKILTMGYQKIHFNPKNNEQNVASLNLILHKDCIKNQYFDKIQSTQLLYEMQKYMMFCSLPNFFDLLFENRKNLQMQYFQPKFLLKGKTLCSLAFDSSQNYFNKFRDALEIKYEQSESDLFLYNSIYQHQAKCINQNSLENFIAQLTIKNYKLNHLYGLMSDFVNYQTVIQAALDHTRQKEVSYLIEYILKTSDPDGLNWYSLMQDIPQILSSTKFNINSFFHVSAAEEELIFDSSSADDFVCCNFERSLNHPDLPQFGEETKYIIHIKDTNEVFFNDEEIQNQIIKYDKLEDKEKQKKEASPQVQVQHTFIAFDPMIRKIKIDKILGRKSDQAFYTDYLDLFENDPKQIKYISDLFISNLIFRNTFTPQFMEQNTVQLIIEVQYRNTKPFVKNLLIAYTFGFYLPYIYASFLINYNFDINNKSTFDLFQIYFLYILAFITQTIFMVFEYSEVKYNGISEYFSDSWNYFDSSQYVFLILNVYLSIDQMDQSSYGFNKLCNQVIQIIILLLATTRILQYIRYKDSFSFLVQMLTAVLIDLAPFLTIFMIFIFVFTLVVIIMQADIDPGDYAGIPKFMRIMIQIFRNSIGDISIIQYGKWGDDDTENNKDLDHEGAKPYAKFIIWTFWFFNLFFMLIIMLNFLIAEVSQTYDKVKSQGLVSIYRQKAALNKLVFQIKHLFGIKNEFRVMTIEKPPEGSESEEFQEFSTFSERIKRNTAEQINKLKSNLSKFTQSQIDNSIEQITKNVEILNSKIQSAESQKIVELEQKINKNFDAQNKNFEALNKNFEALTQKLQKYFMNHQEQEELKIEN